MHDTRNSSSNFFRAKLWTRVGTALWAAALPAADLSRPMPPARTELSGLLLAQGGEGGEAGEMPSSYGLLSVDPKAFAYDAAIQVRGYADLVHASYGLALTSSLQLQSAINALLLKPGAESLRQAQAAWTAARPAYLLTEAFRFYDGPIDVQVDGKPGPESRINAWPLNEAFIDSVRGQPKAGLVNAVDVPLTRESIVARDQVSDEADVTTGWHAIEFLLWGQDFNPDGPGQRSHSDYLPGQGSNDRRRLYLKTVSEQLTADLSSLALAWRDGSDNYRRRFLALPPREALGRMLNGMANLVGHELASERLAVALDSGDQEDEHSCFSDTTHQDHLYDLQGVRNIWFGSLDGEPTVSGLRSLVLRLDAPLAAQTDQLFARALSAVEAMDQPFETILRAAPGTPPRQRAELAVTRLYELGDGLVKVGRKLGVLVLVPGLSAAA